MIGSVFVLVATLSAATTAWARTPAAVIDGISFRYLPSGLGATSDFTYGYDDIDFTSRCGSRPVRTEGPGSISIS